MESIPALTTASLYFKIILSLYLLYFVVKYRNWQLGAVVIFGSLSIYLDRIGQHQFDVVVGNLVSCLLTYILIVYVRLVKTHKHELAATFTVAMPVPGQTYAKSPDGIILNWSKEAYDVYGYHGEEIIGHPVTVLFPPGHKKEELDLIMTKIRSGQAVEGYVTERIRRDGEVVKVKLDIEPIFDGGEVIGARTYVRKMNGVL